MVDTQIEAAAAAVEERIEIVDVEVDGNFLLGLLAGDLDLFVLNG